MNQGSKQPKHYTVVMTRTRRVRDDIWDAQVNIEGEIIRAQDSGRHGGAVFNAVYNLAVHKASIAAELKGIRNPSFNWVEGSHINRLRYLADKVGPLEVTFNV